MPLEVIGKVLRLNDGSLMPLVGLGTWKSKPQEVSEAVKTAIEAGYRLVDCAPAYLNERMVGEALAAKIKDGTITRKQMFITSKLPTERLHPDQVKATLETSLSNLHLSYLDMYLIHWPCPFKDMQGSGEEQESVDFTDTWKVLETCVDEGLVRSIGLSNFNSQQIQRILDMARIKPANVQVEVHPYFSNERLVEFCHARGLGVTAYSPLGSSDRQGSSGDDLHVLTDPLIKSIAEKYNRSPAQIILRHLIQRKLVVIPKSVTRGRIHENQEVFDFELSQTDMDALRGLNRNQRLSDPPVIRHQKEYPFGIDF